MSEMVEVREVPLMILASGSPRRRELLSMTGWHAEVHAASVDEAPHPDEHPTNMVARLARDKAEAVQNEVGARGRYILAADTVVVHKGRMMGKPETSEKAREGLLSLRGDRHQVFTAIHLVEINSDKRVAETCETTVPMRNYDVNELDGYIATGSPMDKAGGYGIQDKQFQPVDLKEIDGCFANVMGLPLCRVVHHMGRLGVKPEVDLTAPCRQKPLFQSCPIPSELGFQE